MEDDMITEMTERFSSMSETELINIWYRNDKNAYTPEIFQALKDICIARKINLPGQKNYSSPNQEAAIPQGYELASIKSRIGASLMNYVFIMCIFVIIQLMLLPLVPHMFGVLFYYAVFLVDKSYMFAFELLFSATPGYLVAGMRVVNESGSRINAKEAMLRTLVRMIPFYFAVIDGKRVLDDKLSGTYVVKRKSDE